MAGLLLTVGAKGYAQISDVDAKLAFQKITDAYESSSYYNAALQSEALKNKMGSWNPKILYIYLESVYKAYNSNNVNEDRFGKQYDTFVGFKKLSDTFFTLIDKNTYPADKLADMITAQQYFAGKVKATEYQMSRTPEKAIGFLNECAQKFRNRAVGNTDDFGTYNLTDGWPMDDTSPFIRFKLDSSYLRITLVTKKKSANGGRFNRVIVWNDIIDLKHAPIADEGKTTFDGRVYIFSHHYYTFDRQGDFNPVDTVALSISNNGEVPVALYKSKFSKTVLNKTPRTVMTYPLDVLFDQNNREFVDGGYAQRIKDAFNYLLDYYPKEKTPISAAKKSGDTRTNGF